jgi:hypothetical protein
LPSALVLKVISELSMPSMFSQDSSLQFPIPEEKLGRRFGVARLEYESQTVPSKVL